MPKYSKPQRARILKAARLLESELAHDDNADIRRQAGALVATIKKATMKLTDWQGKTVCVVASYHPNLGSKGYVASVNRRSRKLLICSGVSTISAFPAEVELS